MFFLVRVLPPFGKCLTISPGRVLNFGRRGEIACEVDEATGRKYGNKYGQPFRLVTLSFMPKVAAEVEAQAVADIKSTEPTVRPLSVPKKPAVRRKKRPK